MADENKQPDNDTTHDDNTEPAGDDPKMTTDEAAEERVGETEEEVVENVAEHDVLDETPQEVAEEVQGAETLESTTGDDEVAVTPEYKASDEAEELPEAENAFEASVAEAMDMAEEESAEEKAEGEGIVNTWDEGVQDVMANMQDVADDDDPVDMTHEHAHTDTVTLPVFGTFDIPGGIYTVIFIALAILTVIEVLAAEAFSVDGGFLLTLQIAVLLLAALAKSVLVVIFYMHLNTDNRIFRLVLGLPFVMMVLLVAYLLAVPTGY